MSRQLRSRIVGHDRVDAATLLANPFNHRRHSKKQQAVVSASLDELGIVKSIIVNRTTGHLVDGHDRLRDAISRGPGTLVDVEYIELSPVEEKKALAMLDAMVALGKVDNEALDELLDGFFPLCQAMSEVVALTPGIANQRLYPEPAWTLCWFYCTGTGRSCWGFSAWQPIMVWGNDPQLANGNGCHPDAFKMDGYEYLATTDDRKEEKLLDHTCPKPLSVWRRFMQRLTFDAKSVYDPFGGSGTTLIAADQLRLQCDTMELSPAYCDVIVERWKRHTGGEPILERK